MTKTTARNKTRRWLFMPFRKDRFPWYESDETDTGRMLDDMRAALSTRLPEGITPRFRDRHNKTYESCHMRARYIVVSNEDLIGVLVENRM